MENGSSKLYKLVRFFSIAVILITLLSVLAFSFRLAFEGNKKLGGIGVLLNEFSLLPRTAMNALREIYSPERFIKIDPELEFKNELNEDILILGSTFRENQWVIYLRNLKDDAIIKEWYLSEANFYKTNREFSNCSPKTPILLDDSSLIFAAESSQNLYRVDKESNIIWHDTSHFYHHSINPAADGNIWTCTSFRKVYFNEKGNEITIADNLITKIDIETGETLYHESISNIFEENNLSYLIHGYSNSSHPFGSDPLHLNDIEAVMDSSEHWEIGDIFFSLRNRSLIVQFRPHTKKVIRLINGPFFHQHDVDIQSDSTITLFDNHISGLELKSYDEDLVREGSSLNQYSRIVEYDLRNDRFKTLYEKQFSIEQPYTPTEGLHEILNNGDIFVESQNVGIIYVISEDKTKLRRYLHEPKNGLVEPPQWVRVVQ